MHKQSMPLFSPKIVQDALLAFERQPTSDETDAASEWAKRADDPRMDLQNEGQLEQEFNRLIVQQVLGYRAPASGMPGTMRVKQPIPGGTTVDLALGEFDGDRATVIAPFELKGPKTRLDAIMPGRNKTPVQQAWDYAMDAPGARWVLLSDMREVRLYAFGHGRQDYERFELAKLSEPEELRRFKLLLGVDRLLGGATANLLARSADADREITDALYRDYRRLRDDLLQFVRDQRSGIDALKRIELVQRLLDRLLFIAFAEDKFLLPQDSLARAISYADPYHPRPKWDQVKKLFEWVNEGGPQISAYNGGLFRADPAIDRLELPDHLVERFALLAGYDYRSEVSVTILGHLFEQSVTDVENLQAEARFGEVPKVGKRKREGVVYTPAFVTRFIVEQTIGKHLTEIAAELLPAFGRAEPDGEIVWRGTKKQKTESEAAYWRAYLLKLAALKIVDPACGSGAFLVAAFDYLHAEQERVRTRLLELGVDLLEHVPETADVGIITNNLFGVDVNAESVELTKLALWLKTAKQNRPLESLEENILVGNSLVADADFHERPFDWHAKFPTIFDGDADEGFDIVLGNPPYVRMEHLKTVKPYLEGRYAVASDRADLYAYFFELGVEVLKPGGRMGYISSSTFFRTGSGGPLRDFLAGCVAIETVVDFGDLQLFEGVTTYPAIVTLRKRTLIEDTNEGALSYLTVRAMPDDLSQVFEAEARPMPRARLGSGTWRFESDALDAIREKIAIGRLTLAEAFGAPLYGIKTGLNDAFVLTREQRDALLDRSREYGDHSEELLKPFLTGENCKRWRVESDDLWLIYTPKNCIEIDDYPAIRDHLAPWRERLEARATKQNWWELQQAQAAYGPMFDAPKIVYCDISNQPTFSVDRSSAMLANTAYFVPTGRPELCGVLGSRAAWFYFAGLTNIAQNGYLRLRTEFVGRLPIPELDEGLVIPVENVQAAMVSRTALTRTVLHRLGDLSSVIPKLSAFHAWSELSFTELQTLLKKRCKVEIPVAKRDEWEDWFDARRGEAVKLAARIAHAEAEINVRVYRSYGLTRTEIAIIEDALTLASPAMALRSYEAVSAVEGLELSDPGRSRLLPAAGPTAARRAGVARAYAA